MDRAAAIDEALEGGEGFSVIAHRDYPGEHETDSDACWCEPFVVPCDDPRTPEEVLADVEQAESAEPIQ